MVFNLITFLLLLLCLYLAILYQSTAACALSFYRLDTGAYDFTV